MNKKEFIRRHHRKNKVYKVRKMNLERIVDINSLGVLHSYEELTGEKPSTEYLKHLKPENRVDSNLRIQKLFIPGNEFEEK